MAEEPTEIAGRFRLERKLGAGAFGEAHLAADVRTGRRVVLKLIHAEHAQSRSLVERFRREIKALELVHHPCIPELVDAGTEDDGRVWYAAEYCEGQDLQRLLKKDPRPWPIQRALLLVDDLLSALGEAHDKGVIHRDIKPANIILVEQDGGERIRLIDFGIAKHLEGGSQTMIDLTQGAAVGTPHYLAPEQAEGESVDARADLYAVGVLLHELLTGRRPFGGETLHEIITKVLRDPPTPVRELRPEVPEELQDLILRLMEKDRANRPGTAREVKGLLRAAVPEAYIQGGQGPDTAVTQLPAHLIAKAETEDLGDPYLGKTIAGKYVLKALLGKGGFGRVYRAWHTELDMNVALKIIHTGDVPTGSKALGEIYERFRREARAMRSFVHKHAVQVRNFGSDDKLFYLELDYLEGETLEDVIKREKVLDEERTLRLAGQILSALGEAHRKGIVHRDLKPANIMLVEEDGQQEARILDFGIVKLVGALEDTTSLTGRGVAIGTVQYMSPEQAGGDEVGLASDVYSLGVVLYLCLSGKMPISGGTVPTQASMRARIMTKPPRPLVEVAPNLKTQTIAAVMSALAKLPDDRPQSAAAFAEELLAGTPYLLGTGGTSRIGPARQPADNRQTSKRTQVEPDEPQGRGLPLALVLVVVLLVVGVGVLLTQPAARVQLEGVLAQLQGKKTAAGKTEQKTAHTEPPKTPKTTEDKTTEKTKPPEKTRPKPPEKTRHKPPEKTPEKTRHKPPEKTPEKTREKPPEKTRHTPPEKTREKPPEKTRQEPPEKTKAPESRPGKGVNGKPPLTVPAWWKEVPAAERPRRPLPNGIGFGREKGTYRNAKDGSVLVYVPAGDGVPAFFMGKYEVTWKQWAKSGIEGSPSAGPSHPATGMTWTQARAYCAWAGLKLPTAAQWMRAAGGAARDYPWLGSRAARGGVWRLNCKGDRDGAKTTARVGTYPEGRSPFGCLDMAGNVAEWCADAHDGKRVLKGGSYLSRPSACKNKARMVFAPQTRRPFVGLRVARPVDAH